MSISTCALREAWDAKARKIAFLSTPSARRATRRWGQHPRHCQISIHALREEGDDDVETGDLVHVISIHALREEGDFRFFREKTTLRKFLSTPSARRATYDVRNPLKLGQISIHALREEGDRYFWR